MELVDIKKGEYRGYYMRWNVTDWDEIVEVPAGKYFRNGKQLIVALQVREDKYSLSSKHSYIISEGNYHG